MKLIFVSGPYQGKTINETFDNIIKARAAAYKLWQQGYAVICPHMNSAFMDGANIDATCQMFYDGDLEMLGRCDAIYMMQGWRESVGSRKEYQQAIELRLEVMTE